MYAYCTTVIKFTPLTCTTWINIHTLFTPTHRYKCNVCFLEEYQATKTPMYSSSPLAWQKKINLGLPQAVVAISMRAVGHSMFTCLWATTFSGWVESVQSRAEFRSYRTQLVTQEAYHGDANACQLHHVFSYLTMLASRLSRAWFWRECCILLYAGEWQQRSH